MRTGFRTLLGVAALSLVGAASAQTLHVFAAASLRESFQALGKTFEATHPGLRVDLNFAGSQQLAAQIGQGASCDVFASADERTLDKVSLLKGSRKVFALNHLVIVEPLGKRTAADFQQLVNVESLVIAAPQVPVGGYTSYAFTQGAKKFGQGWLTRLRNHIVSQEQDVRSVLAKLELGEADAGIVYTTDAISAQGKVLTIPIAPQFQPVIRYPIAIPAEGAQVSLAKEFISLTLSDEGQKVLSARGFVSPKSH